MKLTPVIGRCVRLELAVRLPAQVAAVDQEEGSTDTAVPDQPTQFTYDAVGRLVGVTDALHQQTSYGYDEQGNLVCQTDANGHITRFEHDALGRQTARVLADGARETFVYDAAGQRLTHTDFNGTTRTFSYDALGRLLQRNYPDGTREAFAYTATGRRATATDRRGGVTTYIYDTRDRLLSKTAPDGSQLTLAHDAAGNRREQTVTLGGESASTLYQYDALNRVRAVTDPRGGLYNLSYDPRGLPQQLTYPNGLATSWEHNARSQLTQAETLDADDEVVQSFQYFLSPTSQRLQVTEHDGTRRAYTYDALNRLTEESVHDGADAWIATEQFAYDPVGNRLQSTQLTPDSTTSTAYAYDVRNRLVSVDGQPVAWDAAGRQLSWPGGDGTPGASYSWDVDDRLLAADLADGTAVQTTYDADGQRIQTAVHDSGETTTTGHLVDDTGWLSHEVAELSDGQLGTVYVRAGDRFLGSIHGDPEHDRFYHLDGLGSVRALTDPSGNVQGTLDYTAFGQRLPGTNLSQPYGFTGEPWSKAGLSYHRARWMAPGQGRFLSMDPFPGFLGQPLTRHGYLYVENNPATTSDPSGRASLLSISIASSLLVGVATTGYRLHKGDSTGSAIGHGLSAAFLTFLVVYYGVPAVEALLTRLWPSIFATSTATGVVVGATGQTTRSALERAAQSSSSTVTVYSQLTQRPAVGRGLSVVVDDLAIAVRVGQAARPDGTLFVARIPNRLLRMLQDIGLATHPIPLRQIGTNAAGYEIRFAPQLQSGSSDISRWFRNEEDMTTERIELPDFTEAERLFEEFVLQNGGSGQLTWVFREDLNLSRKKNEILILHPDKALNRALVENAYEESKNQAFGILFDVFCPISEGGYCAYFLIPKDIEDAELRMVYGLKFGTLGSGIRRIGRLSRRPRALGSFMRRFGRERSDPWLLDVPSRQAWT